VAAAPGSTADLETTERRDSEYVFCLGDGFAVDARPMGNKTRRMNHSTSPNVRANVVNHRGVRKVCMYALHDIAQHAELVFDYGPWFPLVSGQV
jgi:SET domain-containing protein